MKLDAHVHTHYSGMTIWPLSLIMRESYNTPERVYRLAKARGMDLVAITDHDTIAGALTLADRPDVIVGCEISASFPGTGADVHLGSTSRVGGSDSHTGCGIGRTCTVVVGGVLGMPLICLTLVGAMLHFLEDGRFNRSLLFDLVACPGLASRGGRELNGGRLT